MGRDQLGRLSVLQNILCHCFIEILKELLETKKQNNYCCSNVFGHNFMSYVLATLWVVLPSALYLSTILLSCDNYQAQRSNTLLVSTAFLHM